ncbi:DUF2779 domain-containing protein, partial [Dehalococcoidia bacterium]|nr:DUF2779 domain-containing protein [Dehalococcoidia bacterium]
LVCPMLGWIMRSEEYIEGFSDQSITQAERFRIEQGIEIETRARQLFTDGILVGEKRMQLAAKKTRELMDDSHTSVIFDGAFLSDGFSTRTDVLRRKGNGWQLIEIKSSVNDREEFIDDIAYTTMVMRLAGFDVRDASLILISKDYRLGMSNDKLFLEIDHTDEVLIRAESLDSDRVEIDEITRGRNKPEPVLQRECKKCPLFAECLGKGIENHILGIPRLSQSKFDSLKELDIVCIEDIPDDFPLTANQARMRDCVITGEPFIGSRLGSSLEAIEWPAFYLDFETTMTAVPLYPDIAPYTQLPTQYSIHKCSDMDTIDAHLEYLADPSKDCRRDLAESLIRDLEHSGSIIIYSSFEKTVLNGLAGLYPDLSSELTALIERMVDLEAIIRTNYYHPKFRGSTSIKRTLPVLVPEMTYENLEIAEGSSASAAFACLALGKYDDTGAESVKRNLLEYCKQDTLAMVKLHQRLFELA